MAWSAAARRTLDRGDEESVDPLRQLHVDEVPGPREDLYRDRRRRREPRRKYAVLAAPDHFDRDRERLDAILVAVPLMPVRKHGGGDLRQGVANAGTREIAQH